MRSKSKDKAKTPQPLPNAIPSGCTHSQLYRIRPRPSTTFMSNDLIQQMFAVEVSVKAYPVPNISKAETKLHKIKWSHLGHRNREKSYKWPNFDSQDWRSKNARVNMNSLEPNKLFVVLVTLIMPKPNISHVGAGVVHKKGNGTIEYFVLEPYGQLFDYHELIAKKYFKANVVHMPFEQVQGDNQICVAHTQALLFRFLRNYKREGTRALETFRTSRTTFSRPPIFNMTPSLGPMKSGRTIESISKPSSNASKGSKRSSRSRTHPSKPENTPEDELAWLQLRARNRGNHNIRSVVNDAKNTFYFQNFDPVSLSNMVFPSTPY